MYRWIGAFLGYLFFKFPGAVLGFLVGMFLEMLFNTKNRVNYTDNTRQNPYFQSDFELNLLSLCALVIKADGHASSQEMQFVQQYFVQQFGKERANYAFRQFNQIAKN